MLRIVSKDIHKIALCIAFGLYELLVMSCRLTNALTTFNRMMEKIFRLDCSFFTRESLYNILVYSKTLKEHKDHLEIILSSERTKFLLLMVQRKMNYFFKK